MVPSVPDNAPPHPTNKVQTHIKTTSSAVLVKGHHQTFEGLSHMSY